MRLEVHSGLQQRALLPSCELARVHGRRCFHLPLPLLQQPDRGSLGHGDRRLCCRRSHDNDCKAHDANDYDNDYDYQAYFDYDNDKYYQAYFDYNYDYYYQAYNKYYYYQNDHHYENNNYYHHYTHVRAPALQPVLPWRQYGLRLQQCDPLSYPPGSLYPNLCLKVLTSLLRS